MAQFQTGHTQSTIRQSGERNTLVSRRLGDQIEGRHIEKKPDHPREPALIRQKRPPVSVLDAKSEVDKSPIVKVKCRQVIRAGQAQTVPLNQARNKFQSHTAKCQSCLHRMQCATA